MKKDLTGQQFGRLVVLEEVKKEGNRKRFWRCRCTCGRETIAEESHLKSGHTKSCGCYRKDIQRQKGVDISGQRFGRLVAIRPVARSKKGTSALTGQWECQCDCGNVCICLKNNLRTGITKSCGCLQEEQRKKNMETAIHFVDGTCVERIACRKTFANNTTGHRGVYRRENNRWRASIGFRGKVYSLGSFSRYEDAVEARLKAERQMYDSFLEEYEREMAEEKREKFSEVRGEDD